MFRLSNFSGLATVELNPKKRRCQCGAGLVLVLTSGGAALAALRLQLQRVVRLAALQGEGAADGGRTADRVPVGLGGAQDGGGRAVRFGRGLGQRPAAQQRSARHRTHLGQHEGARVAAACNEFETVFGTSPVMTQAIQVIWRVCACPQLLRIFKLNNKTTRKRPLSDQTWMLTGPTSCRCSNSPQLGCEMTWTGLQHPVNTRMTTKLRHMQRDVSPRANRTSQNRIFSARAGRNGPELGGTLEEKEKRASIGSNKV